MTHSKSLLLTDSIIHQTIIQSDHNPCLDLVPVVPAGAARVGTQPIGSRHMVKGFGRNYESGADGAVFLSDNIVS